MMVGFFFSFLLELGSSRSSKTADAIAMVATTAEREPGDVALLGMGLKKVSVTAWLIVLKLSGLFFITQVATSNIHSIYKVWLWGRGTCE